MKALFKEPLLHFLLAGGLLFAAYAWINQGGGDDEPRVVRITPAELNWLKETWTRQWSRPPDEQELRGLLAGHLKEQLLAREARELGLELDDTIIRRRLAQKMEFLVKDAASFVEPDELALRQLYKSDQARYRAPARVSFQQIFFRDRVDAAKGLEALKVGDSVELGDSSLLARDFEQADEQTVTAVFGPGFFTEIAVFKTGIWQGPVQSAYGFHLVRIGEYQASQPLPFEQVRSRLVEEWRQARQGEAREHYFAGLLEKYEVVMDEEVAVVLGPLDGALR